MPVLGRALSVALASCVCNSHELILDGQTVWISFKKRNVERIRRKSRVSNSLASCRGRSWSGDVLCETLWSSHLCSVNAATGFDHRVQNVLRIQIAVSWVPEFTVGPHFRGCLWQENFVRICWRSMIRCTFSQVLIFAGTPATNERDRACP